MTKVISELPEMQFWS